ncbi:MAG TPA: hypothetical protein VFR97_05235, partial [Capillimicrobium sp.]|nr:hypothetical protein [Capillimicrobium sp.]
GPQGPQGERGPAGPAGPQGPAAAPSAFASAGAGTVTDDLDYEQVAGGPSLTVTVPASGLLMVGASIDTDGDVAVALYEDGVNISEAECNGPSASLFETTSGAGVLTWGTPAAAGIVCGTFGSPGPVMLSRPPGVHTYELRYALICGCGPATIDNRRLWITPLP